MLSGRSTFRRRGSTRAAVGLHGPGLRPPWRPEAPPRRGCSGLRHAFRCKPVQRSACFFPWSFPGLIRGWPGWRGGRPGEQGLVRPGKELASPRGTPRNVGRVVNIKHYALLS